MNMKTIALKETEQEFEHFFDIARQEPVLVTRRNRPVGVMVSVSDYEHITEQAEREIIRQGVAKGLADADAGKGVELNAELVTSMKQELQSRIDAKQNA